MTANGAYGQMWQEVPLVGSGLAWGQRNGGDENGLASLAVVPGNGLVSSTWKGMYKVIAEVNAFIESMEASSLDETVKTQKLGEARFLRAIAYYNLVSLWGDVPLKLVASSSDGIAMPRTDRVTIFGTIVDDLKAATNISATSSVGRLNSWAAKAFLGKVYYKMAMLDIDRAANLNNAKTMFDDVYEHADYELEPNLNSLFVPYTQTGAVTNSKEAIIQLNFNAESGVCYNRGSNRFAPQASTSGINWGTYRATRYAYGHLPGRPACGDELPDAVACPQQQQPAQPQGSGPSGRSALPGRLGLHLSQTALYARERHACRCRRADAALRTLCRQDQPHAGGAQHLCGRLSGHCEGRWATARNGLIWRSFTIRDNRRSMHTSI